MFQLRFHHNDAIVTDRQHVGPITRLVLIGDKLLSAGHDQRILGFESLPRGPVYFSGPELRSASPFVDMQAVKITDWWWQLHAKTGFIVFCNRGWWFGSGRGRERAQEGFCCFLL